jgi:transcriptional regulator NrdR family protein
MRPPPVTKFRCEFCGHETASRVLSTMGTRRRRECLECRGTFATIETPAPPRQAPLRRSAKAT